jgi:hypothetical protein
MPPRNQSPSSDLIDWMRAKRDQTDLANRRIWQSRCRTYKVIESVGKFEEMGTHWYGILCGEGESILYVGRSWRQAYAACDRHHSPPEPKKRKKPK